jgi:hypothetical protein
MRMRAAVIAVLLAALVLPGFAIAQEAAGKVHPQQTDAELRAAKALDGMRGDPLALHAFLKRMPKAPICTTISTARSMPRPSFASAARMGCASIR